jgi:hypothetical protein
MGAARRDDHPGQHSSGTSEVQRRKGFSPANSTRMRLEVGSALGGRG